MIVQGSIGIPIPPWKLYQLTVRMKIEQVGGFTDKLSDNLYGDWTCLNVGKCVTVKKNIDPANGNLFHTSDT
jgi:hypothetical protein